MTYSISAEGLALIRYYEGFNAEPQPLCEGAWVVGYGHVRVGEPGAAVTEQDAAGLLALDLAPVERLVNANVTARLNQSQFDALCSFVISIGAEAFVQSQVLRRINDAEHVAAACAMDAWRKSDVSGELAINNALVRRRAAEKAMYLRDLPHQPTPSASLKAKLDYAASVLGAPAGYDAAPPPREPAIERANNPGERLTQILKSEPATEALMLTQVVANDFDEEGEIATANAKPSARKIEAAVPVLPIDRRIKSQRARTEKVGAAPAAMESIGLIALMLFGVGLTLIGGSMFYGHTVDAFTYLSAGAFALPGLAAMALSGFGLLRGARRDAGAAAA